MLLTRLRQFAFRVCRFALTAFVRCETSKNDNLERGVSRFFPRVLLVLLVTVSIVATMLVVLPAKKANAAQVWWDYAGNGYVAATTEDGAGRRDEPHSYDAVDAFRDMRIENPIVEQENGRTKVTYKVIFNRNAEFARQLDLGEMSPQGNRPKDGAAYLGRPTLSLFLPKGLNKNSIRVKRYWEGSSGKIGIGDTSAELVREDQDEMYMGFIKTFAGKWTAWTYSKDFNDRNQLNGFNANWNDSIGPSSGDNGVGGGLYNPYKYSPLQGGDENCKYSMCEIYKWNDKNLFETMFASWEPPSDRRYTWIVTAYLENGYTEKDVYTKMPVVAGFRSEWRRNKYAVFGPFDTDGDGIPDYVEHLYNMNPKGVDDIAYPEYEDKMLVDYGKDNVPLTTYGRPITVKPKIKTGKWEGNSSNGRFVYDGGVSTNLPADIGIKYSIVSKSDSSIQVVNSINNMPEGSVYINPNSGHITYNPRKTDKNKTFTFGTEIIYPNPELYNCNHTKSLKYVHNTKIKVIPQSWIYNPVYTPLENVEPTSKDAYTEPPISKKDPTKNKNAIIQEEPLPAGTTFTLKQYVTKKGNTVIKRGDPVLQWSKIETNDIHTGKVHFTPGKIDQGKKANTPVLVTYPDGSTSEEADSANEGAVVYAKVSVKKFVVGQGDLHLQIYKGHDNYNLSGKNVNANSTIHLLNNEPMKPNLILDSWSNLNKGKIVFRSICYEENNGQKSGYKFIKNSSDNFNGLKLGDPVQWKHANEQEEAECVKNNNKCKPNEYLYKKDYEKDTMERSRATISGTPTKKGSFGCRVFAFHSGSDLLKNFDKTAETSLNVLSDFNIGDMASATFKFQVHSLAYWYNPEYKPVTVKAGDFNKANNITLAPNSVQTAWGNGRVGELPKGTWFEFKKYGKYGVDTLEWADFENGESNKLANKDESADKNAKNKGRVTFRPHKWENAGDYKTPVVVHYPDGSSSLDKDSGNKGEAIYAKVKVTRETPGNNDLNLRIYGSNEYKKGKSITPKLVDSWSTYKTGPIHQRMLCHKKDKNNSPIDNSYQLGGINGLKLEGINNLKEPKQWKHATDKTMRKNCNKSTGAGCQISDYLYDYDVNADGNNVTTERTKGQIKGTPNNYGDYECVVYAIKHDELINSFDNAVKNLKNNTSGSNPLKNFQWKLKNNINAIEGIDYKSTSFPISVHSDAHYYNPNYVPVTVEAGSKVETVVPTSVKNANGVNGDQKDIKVGNLPDGTWFELKKDSNSSNNDSYEWSFWENGQKNSNAPDNIHDVNNHKGKDSTAGSGSKYGKVSFHPDVTVESKNYKTRVIVHYPDGSTSETEDAGNQGKPVYANVTVKEHKYSGNDLRMTLRMSKDPNTVFSSGNELYAMRGLNIFDNPFVQAWSVKDRGKIHLRMMCSNRNENKWSRGLGDTLNMHLNHNYGENTPEWSFANSLQQKDCRENNKCDIPNTLYGFINSNASADSVENAVARREEEIVGTPKINGDYVCSVFALKDNALKVFNDTVAGSLIENNKYSSANMRNINLANMKIGRDWNRISFNVKVFEVRLPLSGTPGVIVFVLAGVVLLSSGVFIYTHNYKKRKRNI